jgi:hypothetical protein
MFEVEHLPDLYDQISRFFEEYLSGKILHPEVVAEKFLAIFYQLGETDPDFSRVETRRYFRRARRLIIGNGGGDLCFSAEELQIITRDPRWRSIEDSLYLNINNKTEMQLGNVLEIYQPPNLLIAEDWPTERIPIDTATHVEG